MPERVDTDAYRNLLPSLEADFASLLTRHKEAAGRSEWSYHEFLPLGELGPTAASCLPVPDRLPFGGDGIANGSEPALVHHRSHWGPRELPRADPGIRRVWTVGGRPACDAPGELSPPVRERRPWRPRARQEGHDRGRLESHAVRAVRGNGVHRHPGGSDPRLLSLRRSCVRR